MSPKHMSLYLLVLALVLLATASLAHVQDRRLLSKESSYDTDSWGHHDHYRHHMPPKKHWPPTSKTNDPSKAIPQNKQAQEEATAVEDGYKHPYHKPPWKKHPPTKN